MKKNWNLEIKNDIWVEFWDELKANTVSLKYVYSDNNELINTEIRILPKQPKPDTNAKYNRKAGSDISKNITSQLKTVDMRKINLLILRQRSLNIIFDYQDLNPDHFNQITRNRFKYPITNNEACKRLKKIKNNKDIQSKLALISLLYVNQIHRGNKYPYDEISKSTSYSLKYTKNMIKRARIEKYLTKPINKGILGGELTSKSIKKLSI